MSDSSPESLAERDAYRIVLKRLWEIHKVGVALGWNSRPNRPLTEADDAYVERNVQAWQLVRDLVDNGEKQ